MSVDITCESLASWHVSSAYSVCRRTQPYQILLLACAGESVVACMPHDPSRHVDPKEKGVVAVHTVVRATVLPWTWLQTLSVTPWKSKPA